MRRSFRILSIAMLLCSLALAGCVTEPRNVPQKPTLLKPSDGTTITDSVISFEWNEVANSNSYRIQVDNSSDFSSPEFDLTVPDNNYSIDFHENYGRYYWRVSAKNSDGLYGDPSEEFGFNYLSAWDEKEAMPTARLFLAIAVVNNKIYAIGGTNSGNTSVNEAYDPSTNSWSTKSPMPIAVSEASCGVINNKIYVVGIQDDLYGAFVMYRYDPVSDNWFELSSDPNARKGFAVGVVNDKMYVIGGVTKSTNEEYDPGSDTWTSKAPMPTSRGYLAIAVVNNKIYAIGGRSDNGDVNVNEEYDPSNDTWTERAPMMKGSWEVQRDGMGAGVVNNKIYVIGGSAGGPAGSLFWGNCNLEYDPVSDSWSPKNNMPTFRTGLAIGVVNDKIYTIGGSNGKSAVNINEQFDPSLNQ